MTTEEALTFLSYSTKDGEDPSPGLNPIARRKGYGYLQENWEPTTESEEYLLESAKYMFSDFTPMNLLAFQLGLRDVYLEQGFSMEELRCFFPDVPELPSWAQSA